MQSAPASRVLLRRPDDSVRTVLKLFWSALYQRERYLFFEYVVSQGQGRAHPSIAVYERVVDIPSPFRRTVLPTRLLNPMYYRLLGGTAKLLCYSDDGIELKGFGWTQSWRPFRRKFRSLAADASMLGYYWTAPEHRGQGIYGKLLEHSLYLCSKEKPILICTAPDNKSSQRGITKAGFRKVGEWEITVWLGWFVRAEKEPG